MAPGMANASFEPEPVIVAGRGAPLGWATRAGAPASPATRPRAPAPCSVGTAHAEAERWCSPSPGGTRTGTVVPGAVVVGDVVGTVVVGDVVGDVVVAAGAVVVVEVEVL